MLIQIPVIATVLSVLATAVVAVPVAKSSVPEEIPGQILPSLVSRNAVVSDDPFSGTKPVTLCVHAMLPQAIRRSPHDC
ncbi:hypothetical protein J3R83DRAFT_11905 [Lanmaoa asiatica]|nr:hypothetical protein J3R83DRAFT_11905 [Lanmaoa asiatica]